MLSVIAIVRHGESEGNVANSDQNRAVPDSFWPRHANTWRLTDSGLAQARALGETLSESHPKPFDFYCVSPMARAMETAVNLGMPHAKWRVEPALAERSWGPEQRKLTPGDRELWMDSARRELSADPWGWAPPGGENLMLVQARLRALLCSLGMEKPGASVLLVTHGEVISTLRAHLEGLGASGIPPGPPKTGILLYRRHAGCWSRTIPEKPGAAQEWTAISSIADEEMLELEVQKHERHIR